MAEELPEAVLEKMLVALDQEALLAINMIQDFGSWWTGFTTAIGTAQQGLAAARGGIRRGLTGNGDNTAQQGWLDEAGDAFDTRWKLADESLKPWAAAQGGALPAEEGKAPVDSSNMAGLAADLGNETAVTRTAVVKALLAIQKARATQNMNSVPPQAGDADLVTEANKAITDAKAKFKALDEHFARTGTAIAALPPKVQWNGPTGTTGYPPAAAPGNAPQVPVRTGASPGTPGGPAAPGGPTDNSQTPGGPTAEAPGGPESQMPGGGPAGQDPGAPGDLPTGPGLAGLPTLPSTLPPPTVPSVPLPNLPAPTPPVIPPFTPLPPLGVTPVGKNPKGPFPGGPGVGKSIVGGGGKLGGFGLGKHDLGLDSAIQGGKDVTNGPAQAARQMNGRGLPSVSSPPTAPVAPASPAAPAGSGSSMPPPMMPPMAGGGNGNRPKPGTAQPAMHGKGKSTGRLPGVPQKLRGRSGKSDPAGTFGVPAATQRKKPAPAETVDTVQLLDEELWTVEQPGTPAPNRVRRAH